MIREIHKCDWTEILKIQHKVYQPELVETLESLQLKHALSPETCFVKISKNVISSYCIAYPCPPEYIPKLNSKSPLPKEDHNLFLHDLSVESSHAGQGIGTKMVEHLFSVCTSMKMSSVTLVSVQNSYHFWQRYNFSVNDNVAIDSCYGVDSKFMSCKDLLDKLW